MTGSPPSPAPWAPSWAPTGAPPLPPLPLPPVPWASVRKLLVVRLDNIGDVLMLGPALRALRARLPAAHLTLLASPHGAQAAPLLPWLDAVLVHRALWQDLRGGAGYMPEEEAHLVERLRREGFDAALIFTSFSQSPHPAAYACFLAGIPIRIGQSREFAGGVLSHAVPPLPDEAHQVDRNLHLVEVTGVPPRGRHLEVRLAPALRAAAADRLRQAGVDPEGPFLLLVPGASAAARRYPPERFAEVAREVTRRIGWPVAVLAGPREEAAAEGVAAGGAVRLGTATLPEAAAVVARAAVVVANNSAAMHLAEALRRPLVVLYSGTDLPAQWAPRRTPARLLRRITPCTPCYRFTCPYRLECLAVPPGEVADAVVRFAAGVRLAAGARTKQRVNA